MPLSDLELKHGTQFSVPCRVRNPQRRFAANNSNYLCFRMEDYSKSLKGYAWQGQCDLSEPLHDLDRVLVEGKVREFNGEFLASVTAIQPLNDSENSVALLPGSICPRPVLLARLDDLVGSIANRDLALFVNRVIADDTIAFPFVRLPASRNHHHAVAGGLLEHSLECVGMVQHFQGFDPDMKDLAVTAALFHDIGKVVTLRGTGRFCLESVVLDHNALTLEILAPHLKTLDAINKEMATALRYLWTWRNYRRGAVHPALTIAEAIAAADRISSGLSIEKRTFMERPSWQTIVRNGPRGSLIWRLGC